MTARLNIAHDLDPTGFRYLGGRGTDIVLDGSGDITLGQGNCFRVTAGAGSVLARVSAAGWTQGSPVHLQLVGGISVAHGTAGAGDLLGIRTPTADTVAVDASNTIALVLVGTEWVMLWGGRNETIVPVSVPSALAWTPCYSLNFATLADAALTEGANTISGKTWYVSNYSKAATMSVNPSGTGLPIKAKSDYMLDISAQQDSPAIGITLAELMGMTNVDLKVDRVRIWVQADWVEAMSEDKEHFAVMLGWSQYNSGWLQTLSWRIRQRSGMNGTAFDQHSQHVSLPNSNGDSTRIWQTGANPPSTHYDVFLFEWWPNLHVVNTFYGRYTTRWPTIDEVSWCGKTVVGTSEFIAKNTGAIYIDSTYPFFAVTASPEDSGGTHANVLLKKIKVEYQSTSPTSEGRPQRSTATVDTGIVTIPSRSQTGTLYVSGAVVLDGVDVGASEFVDGDEFELILTGSGSVVFNHAATGLGTGVLPFAVPGPSGESGLGVLVGGTVPVRNVTFRYLAGEGYVLLSGGMLA